MNRERWQRICDVLEVAMELDPAERTTYLRRQCGTDVTMRQDLDELLLMQQEVRTDFLESPGVADAILESADSGRLDSESENNWSMVGRRLGAYRLEEEIGSGGMGDVYRAIRDDDQFHKEVAVKLVSRGLDSKAVIQSFRNERQILAGLEHPNIARLLDGGTTGDGQPYFVMELVDGLPIDKFCDQQKLDIPERLDLFVQVCAAVQYAHQHLTIHRDLKPSNILVTPDRVPKLLDFGIAKIVDPTGSEAQEHALTLTRALTPRYASPEQIKGGTVTTASDVYSLGVVLYELLSGRSPYGQASAPAPGFADAVCSIEPEKPSTAVLQGQLGGRDRKSVAVPGAESEQIEGSVEKRSARLSGDLDNIALKALRKEPERRYASAEQLSDDIRRHLEHRPVLAREDTFFYRSGKFVRRHRTGVVAGALLSVSIIAGLLAVVREARIARQQAEVAKAQSARADRRFNDVRKLANSLIFDLQGPIRRLAGSISVEKTVVATGLQYLDSLAQESGGDPSLQRELAGAYKKLGDTQGSPYGSNLGDVEGALASYRKSLRMWQTLARDDPHNFQDQIQLAKAYRTIGSFLNKMGNSSEARDDAKKALQIVQPLAEAQPDNDNVLHELGADFIALSVIEGEDLGGGPGNPDAALRYDNLALHVFRRLAVLQPDEKAWRKAIAFMNDLASAAALQSGRPVEAMQRSREAIEILQRLNADPGASTDAVLKNQIATTHSKLGATWSFLGQWNKAISEYRLELALLKDLSRDAQDNEAHAEEAGAYVDLGNALVNSGAPGPGLHLLRSALRSRLQAPSDPSGPEKFNFFAQNYVFQGEAMERLGDNAASLELYTKAAGQLASLRALQPDRMSTKLQDAAIHVKIAGALAKLGRIDEAHQEYDRALRMAETATLAVPANLHAQYVLAEVYAGLGDLASMRDGGRISKPEMGTEACGWYKKNLDMWQKLPVQNTIAPNGFLVTASKVVSAKMARCGQTLGSN